MTRLLRLLPVALAALVLLAGCGGDDGGGEAGPDAGDGSQTLSVTLTDTECTYEGPTSTPAGQLSIDVENETELASRFELFRVEQGVAVEDLVAYVQGEQLSIGDGQQPAWPPPYGSVVDQVPVRPRWNTTLAAQAQPGTYAVVCWVAPPPTAVYLATTLDVG